MKQELVEKYEVELAEYSDLALLAVLNKRAEDAYAADVGDPIPEYTVEADNHPAERVIPKKPNPVYDAHIIVCSNCKERDKVPFKPSPDYPVYCKKCFDMKRRGEL